MRLEFNMINLTLIAAIGENYELGKGNQLIWHIPEDMKFFKENTINKPIVMGRKTLESLPRLLPKRKHLVLTHQSLPTTQDIEVFHELETLLKYLEIQDQEAMVIGGAQVYKQLLPYANKMLLTKIVSSAKADVYFPKFSEDEWTEEVLSTHTYQEIPYKHLVYYRKKEK